MTMTQQETANKLRDVIELILHENEKYHVTEASKLATRLMVKNIVALTSRAMISKSIPDEAERKGWSNDYIVGYSARVADELILADLIEKL